MAAKSFSQSSVEQSARTDVPSGVGATDDLAELQDLLFGRERAELKRLRKRVEELGYDAEQVSQVLPDAILLRSRRDQQLGKALMPTVEETLRQSVRRNPQPLANAIFPVIGPAIRKAVAQSVNGLIQALNNALEHSLSWRGLKWRWEAIRSGVPFAQVVLRHTLVYRVEQVFLIHRETGLLLEHVATPGTEGQDPDLVSGMLSAIQDFVSDSFGAQEGSGLQMFRVDGLSGRVELGPHATLAAVVRGHPPADLAAVLQDALETVHLELGDELATFDGDTAPYAAARGALEQCLRSQVQGADRPKRLSPVLKVAAALVVLALAVWAFLHVRAEWRWNRAVERLEAEPGLTVLAAAHRWGKYYVSGLKDPAAPEPAAVLAGTKIPVENVVATWEPYLSVEAAFVERRANHLLEPPSSVTLRFEDGVLYATGSASDAWVVAARGAAPLIPGVTIFDISQLVDRELQELENLRDEIEQQRIEFSRGTSRLGGGLDSILSVLVVRIERLREGASAIGRAASVELLGRTDEAGSDASNILLSSRRADAVLSALVARGVARSALSSVGLGSSDPLQGASPQEDARLNRSVSFRVAISEPLGVRGRVP